MVVPDRQLIMENMLMAEGFVEAKMLAKKFASLYYLLEDLLSPAKYVLRHACLYRVSCAMRAVP